MIDKILAFEIITIHPNIKLGDLYVDLKCRGPYFNGPRTESKGEGRRISLSPSAYFLHFAVSYFVKVQSHLDGNILSKHFFCPTTGSHVNSNTIPKKLYE